jgi:hypothetical protein
MKKTILTLGNALEKAELKKIQGGFFLEEPCNGCPTDFVHRCCHYDDQCEAFTFITSSSWPQCEF